MSDLTFFPAVVMAQQILENKISPVEIADAHLAKLNALVYTDADRARLSAQAG